MQECLVLEKYVTVAHFGVLGVILSNDFFINNLGFPAYEDCMFDDLLLSAEVFFTRLPPLVGYIGGKDAVAGEFFLELIDETS